MSKLIKGLKIAANVAEIVVAGSVVFELVQKYGGKITAKWFGQKVDVKPAPVENDKLKGDLICE